MKRLKKVIISLMMVMLISCNGVTAFSAEDSATALTTLCDEAKKDKDSIYGWDYADKTYKRSNGSYFLYSEIVNTGKSTDLINDSKMKALTTGAKSDFLTDYYNAAQKVTDESEMISDTNGITTQVMTNWMELLQNEAGVGSQLLTTLMSQTKPDYVTANRIYDPFSETVGTILAILAILLMAFLAITMVLDLSYIAIPAFQLFIDGDGNGNGQGGGKKKSFISHEAMEAVQMAEGGQGGGGQSGSSNKLAVSIYFKKRVLMLIVLGVCLLYLVSGEIFAFVGWLIDRFSGFLGF